MCYGCWETTGKPNVITPHTAKAVRLIDQVYQFSLTGGALHIVLDDWNLEDGHLEHCRKAAVKFRDELIAEGNGAAKEKYQAEIECLDLLDTFSVDERATALAIYDGFIDVEKEQ